MVYILGFIFAVWPFRFLSRPPFSYLEIILKVAPVPLWMFYENSTYKAMQTKHVAQWLTRSCSRNRSHHNYNVCLCSSFLKTLGWPQCKPLSSDLKSSKPLTTSHIFAVTHFQILLVFSSSMNHSFKKSKIQGHGTLFNANHFPTNSTLRHNPQSRWDNPIGLYSSSATAFCSLCFPNRITLVSSFPNTLLTNSPYLLSFRDINCTLPLSLTHYM